MHLKIWPFSSKKRVVTWKKVWERSQKTRHFK